MNIVIVTQKPIQALNLIYLLGGIDVFPGAIIAIKPGRVSADCRLVDEYTESINALKLQCDILSIPLHIVESLTSNKVIDLLTSLKIDLILSLIAEILNEEFIKTSRYGVVSSHGGVLPSYRGVDCTKWAILNNDNNQVGVTTQLIDQGVDTGEIIDIHTIDLTIARPCKVSDLSREIFYKYKLPSFVNVVRMLIKNGRIDARKQNALDGRQYFSMHYKLCEVVEKKLNHS
jgi:folate-dependent phosphoribosylglycinamide formyltransferase PurN